MPLSLCFQRSLLHTSLLLLCSSLAFQAPAFAQNPPSSRSSAPKSPFDVPPRTLEPRPLPKGSTLTTSSARATSPASETPSTLAEHTYAILIGVKDYSKRPDRAQNLEQIPNDLIELAKTLHSSGKIPFLNIKLLFNSKANRSRIKATIESLAAELKRKNIRDATVILYFTGHGASKDSKSYWLLQGASANALPYNAVSSDEFNAWIKQLPTQRIVVFADACYSGGLKGAKSDGAGKRRGFDSRAFGEGFIRISSSMQDQVSYEDDSLKHGIFTYALIRGLQGAADPAKRGVITLAALWDYLSHEVERLSFERKGERQRPVREGIEAGVFHLLQLPSYRGGLPLPSPPPPPNSSLSRREKRQSIPVASSAAVEAHIRRMMREDRSFEIVLAGGGATGGGGFLHFSWRFHSLASLYLAGGGFYGGADLDTGFSLRGLGQGFFAAGVQFVVGDEWRFVLRAAPAVGFGQGVSPALFTGLGLMYAFDSGFLLGTTFDLHWSPLTSVGSLLHLGAHINLGYAF